VNPRPVYVISLIERLCLGGQPLPLARPLFVPVPLCALGKMEVGLSTSKFILTKVYLMLELGQLRLQK